MKPKSFILMLVMGMVIIALLLPVLAKEQRTAEHTPKNQEQVNKLAEEQHEPKPQEKHTEGGEPTVAEEQGEHAEAEPAGGDEGHGKPKEQGEHAEAGDASKAEGHGEAEPAGKQGEHKEYPKLAEGINKIAYLAIGFITFVLIAVPIGAHLEKKKHPHASHH